jgi:hypothetical protein
MGPNHMKKPKRQKQRQRQKASRKTLILICAASASCMIIGLTIFFNLSHLHRTNATGSNVLIVSDQVFTNEKSIPAPVIERHVPVNSNSIFARQAKALPQQSNSVIH